jgi:hypothetical protein
MSWFAPKAPKSSITGPHSQAYLPRHEPSSFIVIDGRLAVHRLHVMSYAIRIKTKNVSDRTEWEIVIQQTSFNGDEKGTTISFPSFETATVAFEEFTEKLNHPHGRPIIEGIVN